MRALMWGNRIVAPRRDPIERKIAGVRVLRRRLTLEEKIAGLCCLLRGKLKRDRRKVLEARLAKLVHERDCRLWGPLPASRLKGRIAGKRLRLTLD